MKARILIVENDAVTALDLEGLLSDAGYFLTGIAASANQAVEMAKRSPPDLVLLDIGIAGNVDGIELARRLQESLSLAHIYVTGHIEPAVLARANHTNPLGYIVKPYNDAELLLGIEIALCRNGQRNAILDVADRQGKDFPRAHDRRIPASGPSAVLLTATHRERGESSAPTSRVAAFPADTPEYTAPDSGLPRCRRR